MIILQPGKTYLNGIKFFLLKEHQKDLITSAYPSYHAGKKLSSHQEFKADVTEEHSLI